MYEVQGSTPVKSGDCSPFSSTVQVWYVLHCGNGQQCAEPCSMNRSKCYYLEWVTYYDLIYQTGPRVPVFILTSLHFIHSTRFLVLLF